MKLLKTDYKNAIYSGNRKYKITTDANGVSEIADNTEYTQEGDRFGGGDINATNTEINRLNQMLEVTLLASGWSSTAPYSQTVAVEGIEDTDRPVIECIADVASKAQKRAMAKAWDMVDKIVTGDGTITAYCNFEKPDVDIPLRIKGA